MYGRGCQENITNMQEGITIRGDLPHDGHEEKTLRKTLTLGTKIARKNNKKRTHRRFMKKSNKLKTGTQATKMFVMESKKGNL